MKKTRLFLSILVMMSVSHSFAQSKYPEQDTDYKSTWNEDYSGDDYTAYTYYLESTCSEPIFFHNFRITPDNEKYEIIKDIPDDILILYPYQKAAYFQVKAYTSGPAINWNAKFLRVPADAGTYPTQNRDYVYYWKSSVVSDGYTMYSYHLKNISGREIKFHDFSLTNNGGIYYLVDNLLNEDIVTQPGQSIQLVRFNQKDETETPSATWYADWSTNTANMSTFCQGLWKVIEASTQENFGSAKGVLKESADDSDGLFDTYYCSLHLDGVTDEVISDLIILLQYNGTIGSSAPLDAIMTRFNDYRSQLAGCLTGFTEEVKDDDGITYKKAEYTSTADFSYNVTLSIYKDYVTEGYYQLEISVDEAF